jgi:hypothetical protein
LEKGDTQTYNASPNPTVPNSITTISIDGLTSGTEYEYSYYLKWPAGDGAETTRSEVYTGGSFTTALATDVAYLYDIRYWVSEVDRLTVTVDNLSPGQAYYVQLGCTQASNTSSIEQIIICSKC